MTQITYTKQGDYWLPNLLPPQEPQIPLGKYALMRRRFLQQSRKVTYTNLLTTGQLHSHLMEIEQTARNRMERIVTQMAQAEGVTEEMKASDQMKWVGLMNNFRSAAEEQILQELIYA
ncbi:MAG: TnpV protein [Faecousia sp.]